MFDQQYLHEKSPTRRMQTRGDRDTSELEKQQPEGSSSRTAGSDRGVKRAIGAKQQRRVHVQRTT